jgi:glucose-6-phosphate 1-epimerase
MSSTPELNRRFSIPGAAMIAEGNGGLPVVQITTSAATGAIYLHGAHVTSWVPAGQQDVLYLSPRSLYQEGKAIRGGVPVCFPWFGDKKDDPHAPAHGFVRTKAWQLDSIEKSGEAVAVSMSTASDESTRSWWPYDFRLVHRVTFGAELLLELVMSNTGSETLHFEEALHAYSRVGDATQANVTGLDGVHYLDKTDAYRERVQEGGVVIRAETDRVYLDTAHELELNDPVLHRRTSISKENSRTTVVWNPWSEKAAAMGDLGADQWKSMLCIEVTNVGEYAVELQPGEEHTMRARVRVG